MSKFKLVLKHLLPFADIVGYLLVWPAGVFLKLVRRVGVQRLPRIRGALMTIGVFPIRNHYYEPLFHPGYIGQKLSEARALPAIDLNVAGQLDELAGLRFSDELLGLPAKKTSGISFYLENGAFLSGDAEYLYNVIRSKRPQNIIEVGSGNSTLMSARAIAANKIDGFAYDCLHTCIEPFEMPWLESIGVTVLRQKVEDVPLEFFRRLGQNDLLFIDSSHVIRPQGDVLFLYLQVLPMLAPGVIVHIHDIFTPHDYLEEWILEDVRFWNEQYLLEAFLSNNRDWKVIGALNFLHHNYYAQLSKACPYLTREREPGSFYMQKLR